MSLVKLNLARNCIKYLIRVYGINEIFVPYYTCETVWTAIREENCKIHFYHIDKNFTPAINFPPDAFIIYTNYFGICTDICKNLAKQYKNLIIDNSHAFYSEHIGLASFNSLRKFFPVTNGAYFYTNKLLNENFEQDKTQLPYANFQQNYKQFVHNELILNNEKSIKYLSENVLTTMQNIDLLREKEQRLMIFEMYQKVFEEINSIKLTPKNGDVPYCYPFSPTKNIYKKTLLENNIILLKLWKDFPENSVEKWLNDTVALPLNDINYAEKIIKICQNL